MMTPSEALSRYWGYDDFRPLQRDIIDAVMEGHDVLGMLPTGGGKSLTFQVPAMCMEGMTLVITPLIALMKDQVDNLASHGIRGVCLHSGMTRRETQLGLDRCYAGRAKFLYVSPEKLMSSRFVEQLRHMNVSLIVVDEAHCISQWGYDFRPAYLRITEVRHQLERVPVLALTASATPDVAEDICRRLDMSNPVVVRGSFRRDNLSYVVRSCDFKEQMIVRVFERVAGSGIVYTRSRRKTREVAQTLNRAGISASFYHAGLDAEEKIARQNAWKEGRVRVMVATNAFGMGIDKPDVRAVVHIDIPSSLEEYYQEAGRAGRDGLSAYCVALFSTHDRATLMRRVTEAFPDKDFVRRVYELACNYVNVAVGTGYGHAFEFDFDEFCSRFKLSKGMTRNALGLLTRAGYVDYEEDTGTRSRVMITGTKEELYALRISDDADTLLQYVLRTYTGLFADYVEISDSMIAERLEMDPQRMYEAFLELNRTGVVHYIPRRNVQLLTLTTSRELPRYVQLPRAVYEDMRQRLEWRIRAVIRYMTDSKTCRQAMISDYFGQTDKSECGRCDVCREHNRKPVDGESLRGVIERFARQGGRTIAYVSAQTGISESNLIETVREMMDEDLISLGKDKVLVLNQRKVENK